jgi:hypothetical protein
MNASRYPSHPLAETLFEAYASRVGDDLGDLR